MSGSRSETIVSGAADILIVGASARAAAHSALRAGFAPVAIDRFGDADLRGVCSARVIEDYPDGLVDAFTSGDTFTSDTTALPWMYTGALENYPELIHRLAARRPLWGNPADVVRRVRDPWQLHDALTGADIPTPSVRRLNDPPPPNDPPPSDERWLTKSPHSSGGSGVRGWPTTTPQAPSAYLQRYIAGIPVSAVFVAAGRCSRLLGTSQQLIGNDWAGSDGYRYVGSLASRDVPPQFTAIGNALAEAFELTGLFGVDAILADNTVWPIEVNPRYTASVEVIERITGIAAIDLHVRACRDGELPEVRANPGDDQCAGKAILFARHDFVISPALIDHIIQLNHNNIWPVVADIPSAGTPIPQGAPILTVFATATDAATAQKQLQHTARELESLLLPS
jgi:predicted ATP-grasp superfamily ATP-dependent carboligase